MARSHRATVFVYGTLRQGGVRAIPALFPDARLLGPATVPGRLRDLGAYPGLVLDPEGPGIAGEVYEVSAGARRRTLGSPIAATDWIAHARAKGDLPPEAWPPGSAP